MFSSALSLLKEALTALLLPHGAPEQIDLCFLRLSAALSALALAVYDAGPQDVGSGSTIYLPAPPPPPAPAAPQPLPARLAARLVHLRQPGAAGECSPQQWGVWEVEGLGLVVAFRGTAALEDCLLNASIRPQPLPLDAELQRRGVRIALHGGFLEGALGQAAAVAAAVRAARRRLQQGAGTGLWLTGHSLGGAYAAALGLLLLADASFHDLLSCGEWSSHLCRAGAYTGGDSTGLESL